MYSYAKRKLTAPLQLIRCLNNTDMKAAHRTVDPDSCGTVSFEVFVKFMATRLRDTTAQDEAENAFKVICHSFHLIQSLASVDTFVILLYGASVH